MIYLDNAATTKVYASIIDKLIEYNDKYYFNPSSVYSEGVKIKNDIKNARNIIAELIKAKEEQIYFTSGATEANNIFLQGVLTAKKDQEFVFSAGEHSSVNAVANFIKSKGYKVHFVNLLTSGQVDINHLKQLVNLNTSVVSVMHVNNETGAINDLKTISKVVKEINHKTLVHSDGVQAFGKIEVNIKSLGVDAYVISGHKIHGPKGVGVLFINDKVKLKPLILGGGQQKGLRSGTENVAGIIGLVKASEIICKNRIDNYELVKSFKKYFLGTMQTTLNNVIINAVDNSSPYICNLSIKGIRGEILVHMLQKKGVLISTGSSCSSNSKRAGNKVLEAMGLVKQQIESTIRVSFSSFNTTKELKEATNIIIETIKELREKMR